MFDIQEFERAEQEKNYKYFHNNFLNYGGQMINHAFNTFVLKWFNFAQFLIGYDPMFKHLAFFLIDYCNLDINNKKECKNFYEKYDFETTNLMTLITRGQTVMVGN